MNTPATTGTSESRYGRAMAVVTTVFFMWGFVTVLNDILVPHLKSMFELNYTQIMLIQFTFFSAYFLMSLPSAKVIEKMGYQRSIVLGLVVMGAGALVFVPAARAASYPVFLLALWILASGITLLQVAANPYVAVLGPPESSSSRLNLSQAFNSLGTAVGPIIGGFLILSQAPLPETSLRALGPEQLQAYRAGQASSVELPYIVIAVVLLLLAWGISRFHLPVVETIDTSNKKSSRASFRLLWKHPNLVFGAAAIFLYVGAEVSIGSFLVNYFSQPDIGAMTERVASRYVSLYWTGAMVGRFIGSAVLRKTRPGATLGLVAIVACLLVCASMSTFGMIAVGSILAVGLFNSIMFPTIFTLGIAGLGTLTGEGSGILVMAIVGGAIVPVAQGALADHIGIHTAFFLPALCYLYIAFYGFRGSRPAAA